MAVSDVLKNLRQSDYSTGPGKTEAKETPSSSRVIQLTDEEANELRGYQQGPGQEQVCEVTGKLEEDGHFHVMSVHAPQGGMEKDMAKEVAGLPPPPMMRSSVAPSPS